MDKRQGFWWAASLALLGLWLLLITIAVNEWGHDELIFLLWGLGMAIATASHWLNRPGAADTELEELTMEAKKARLRSEITGLQQGQAQSNGLPIRNSRGD